MLKIFYIFFYFNVKVVTQQFTNFDKFFFKCTLI